MEVLLSVIESLSSTLAFSNMEIYTMFTINTPAGYAHFGTCSFNTTHLDYTKLGKTVLNNRK